MATELDLLTFGPGLASRALSYDWDVVDRFTGAVIGELNPEPGAQIQNDAQNATVKRTVRNLVLTPDEADSFNPYRDRIRPYMVMASAGVTSRKPLGVFMVNDDPRDIRSFGQRTTLALFDQGQILADPIDQTISIGAEVDVVGMIAELAARVGVLNLKVNATTIGSPTLAPSTWIVSATNTWAKVIGDLAKMAGLLDPYFDNDGYLVVREVDSVLGWTPLRYTIDDEASRVIDGTVKRASDKLRAPNRYLAIDTSSANTGGFVGRFDIDSSAPHSYENRGRWVTSVQTIQGLTSQSIADATAKAYAAQERFAVETVTMSALADPRHDTWDVVSFDESQYREHAWRITAAAGAPMEHTLKRTYA